MRRICVFCGSSQGSRPEYRAATEEMAEELARRNIGLVYGGGNVGLMGVLADAVLRAGGERWESSRRTSWRGRLGTRG
jgi:predicted Rossmann-fold nucleotide-binding protein